MQAAAASTSSRETWQYLNQDLEIFERPGTLIQQDEAMKALVGLAWDFGGKVTLFDYLHWQCAGGLL
jgi:hypothetical protein